MERKVGPRKQTLLDKSKSQSQKRRLQAQVPDSEKPCAAYEGGDDPYDYKPCLVCGFIQEEHK